MVRLLKNRADRLFEQGRFKECADLRAQIVDLDRRDPWLRLRCAEAFLRAGDVTLAENWFVETAKAFVARGQIRQARAVIGAASAQLGRSIDAVDVLRATPVCKPASLPPYVAAALPQQIDFSSADPIEIEIYIDDDPPCALVTTPIAGDLIDEATFDDVYSRGAQTTEQAARFFAALSYPSLSGK